MSSEKNGRLVSCSFFFAFFAFFVVVNSGVQCRPPVAKATADRVTKWQRHRT